MLHRIDGGDAEQIRDRGVGGAAAALAEDAVALREMHRVPHHEEESGEAESVDDAELVLDLLRCASVSVVAPPLASRHAHTFSRGTSSSVCRRRDRELRQRRTHPARAGSRDSTRCARSPRCPARVPCHRSRHLLGREQPPLAVRMEQPAPGRGVDVDVVAQRGEDVVHEPAVVVDVARIVRDDPRHPASLGELDERAGERSFVAAGVVQLHFDGEPVAEHLAPFVEHAARVGAIAGADGGGDGPGGGSGERMEPGAVLGDFAPGHVRPAAARLPVGLGPARPRAHARTRDERGEVAIAFGGADDERGGPPVHAELGADDRPQRPTQPRRVHEPRNAAEVGGVGDAEGGVA